MKLIRKCATRENIEGIGEVRVIRYEELLTYAEKKLGIDEVERSKRLALENSEWDDREMSLRIVDNLMIQCQELAPATVILYTPPYYPAVNTSNNPLVKESVELIKKEASEFDLEVEQIHYFNGICDLSYVNYEDDGRWMDCV